MVVTVDSFMNPETQQSLLARSGDNSLRPLVPAGSSQVEHRLRAVGVGVEVHSFDALENLDVSPLSTTLGLNLGQPLSVEFQMEARWRPRVLDHQDVVIFSAGRPFSSRTRTVCRGVLVQLQDQVFNRLLAEERQWELPSPEHPMVTRDSYLAESLRLLATHASGAQGRGRSLILLHAETIAASIAVHLVTRYGVGEPSGWEGKETKRGDAKFLSEIDAYIDEHLGNEIRLSALAAIAGLSPFHFSRRFKAATGTSPYRYVMDRRLERGIQLLQRTRNPISEIALEVGFCDQSHFTRELSRSYGITPSELRQSL